MTYKEEQLILERIEKLEKQAEEFIKNIQKILILLSKNGVFVG